MPATSRTAVVTLPSDTTIRIVREFDAPADLVWRCWTEPDLIRRWWTARRGDMTLCEVDLRVGGQWRWVMLAHGEMEVGFHGDYKEIVPGERLVYTEAYEGIPDPDGNAALTSITFTEVDGRTTADMLVEHRDQEGRDMHIDSGMEDGMQDAFDLMEQAAISLRA